MICRDPAFWRPVVEHPDVKAAVTLDVVGDWLTPVLESPAVTPFRGRFGGYFLHALDPMGRHLDLHAAFRPEGWGRDSYDTLIAALRFHSGWDVMTASEVEGNWRSRAPRSFGFRPATGFRGGFRTWVLTRDAWEASPAYRRVVKQCLQQ